MKVIRDWGISNMRKGSESRTAQSGEEKAFLSKSVNTCSEGAKRKVIGSLVVPSDRTRGNGHKMRNRRLPLNLRNTLYCKGY